jgi:hypothetical protein
MAPNYPVYPKQPFTGDLPSMLDVGPPDARYSSGTANYYKRRWNMAHGRNLAGLPVAEAMAAADAEKKETSLAADARDQLQALALDDDVEGNGIFEPPGTLPNVYTDSGIFASSYSLPGYYARERMFEDSEVIDATTGRPIRPVPSGAVAMNDAAQIAFLERGLYQPPKPAYGPPNTRVRSVNTADVMQHPIAVGQTTSPNTAGKLLLGAGLVGLVVGVAFAMRRKGR